MSVSSIKIKRNVYVKGFKTFPYQLLTGKHILCYTGDVICGIESEPPEYDYKKDWYFDCDCEFHEWGKLVKIDETKIKKK